MALMYCRECGKQVSSEAPVCPHCGAPEPVILPPQPVQQNPQQYAQPAYYVQPQQKDTTVAALLSFFLPGVGQMYKGDVGLGIGFLVGTLIGYLSCIFPGIILHIFSIINAAQRD